MDQNMSQEKIKEQMEFYGLNYYLNLYFAFSLRSLLQHQVECKKDDLISKFSSKVTNNDRDRLLETSCFDIFVASSKKLKLNLYIKGKEDYEEILKKVTMDDFFQWNSKLVECFEKKIYFCRFFVNFILCDLNLLMNKDKHDENKTKNLKKIEEQIKEIKKILDGCDHRENTDVKALFNYILSCQTNICKLLNLEFDESKSKIIFDNLCQTHQDHLQIIKNVEDDITEELRDTLAMRLNDQTFITTLWPNIKYNEGSYRSEGDRRKLFNIILESQLQQSTPTTENKQPRTFYISGGNRCGKTAFLQEVCQHSLEDHEFPYKWVVYLDKVSFNFSPDQFWGEFMQAILSSLERSIDKNGVCLVKSVLNDNLSNMLFLVDVNTDKYIECLDNYKINCLVTAVDSFNIEFPAFTRPPNILQMQSLTSTNITNHLDLINQRNFDNIKQVSEIIDTPEKLKMLENLKTNLTFESLGQFVHFYVNEHLGMFENKEQIILSFGEKCFKRLQKSGFHSQTYNIVLDDIPPSVQHAFTQNVKSKSQLIPILGDYFAARHLVSQKEKCYFGGKSRHIFSFATYLSGILPLLNENGHWFLQQLNTVLKDSFKDRKSNKKEQSCGFSSWSFLSYLYNEVMTLPDTLQLQTEPILKIASFLQEFNVWTFKCNFLCKNMESIERIIERVKLKGDLHIRLFSASNSLECVINLINNVIEKNKLKCKISVTVPKFQNHEIFHFTNALSHLKYASLNKYIGPVDNFVLESDKQIIVKYIKVTVCELNAINLLKVFSVSSRADIKLTSRISIPDHSLSITANEQVLVRLSTTYTDKLNEILSKLPSITELKVKRVNDASKIDLNLLPKLRQFVCYMENDKKIQLSETDVKSAMFLNFTVLNDENCNEITPQLFSSSRRLCLRNTRLTISGIISLLVHIYPDLNYAEIFTTEREVIKQRLSVEERKIRRDNKPVGRKELIIHTEELQDLDIYRFSADVFKEISRLLMLLNFISCRDIYFLRFSYFNKYLQLVLDYSHDLIFTVPLTNFTDDDIKLIYESLELKYNQNENPKDSKALLMIQFFESICVIQKLIITNTNLTVVGLKNLINILCLVRHNILKQESCDLGTFALEVQTVCSDEVNKSNTSVRSLYKSVALSQLRFYNINGEQLIKITIGGKFLVNGREVVYND